MGQIHARSPISYACDDAGGIASDASRYASLLIEARERVVVALMRLPHGDQAIVEMVKLQEYCLSPTHPRGRHKARVFAAVLGITADNAEILRDALLRAALAGDAILTSQDAFGQRYVIDFQMQGPRGTAIVRSAWIVRTGEHIPRLTSCYVR